jgi:polysaccharide pyruvyl transferase WcaK-like protein
LPDGQTLINAGDKVLSEAVQSFIRNEIELPKIKYRNCRKVFTKKDIDWINNNNDALIIGGGGLFLYDTFKNIVSDWQWGISNDLLKQIKIPVIVLSVGYNRFRGQREFCKVFSDTVTTLVEKSAFFSMRHHGDIEKIKNYLPERLHEKVKINFCPTLLHNKLSYGYRSELDSKRFGILIAGDRLGHRHHDIEQFVRHIRQFIGHIESNNYKVSLLTHTSGDLWLAKKYNFDEHINLSKASVDDIYKAYSKFEYVLADRGHGQMLAFAAGCKIMSCISHDKLKYFLDDLGISEYGVEENDEKLVEKLVSIFDQLKDTDRFKSQWEAGMSLIEATNNLNTDYIRSTLNKEGESFNNGNWAPGD